MKAELVTHYGDDLSPVNAARVSFAKESEWDHTFVEIDGEYVKAVNVGFLQDKDKKLIDYLAKNKHTSCFEHQGAALRLKVPIFIARQIQRHRTFAYNEISRRYVDNPPEFFWPEKWRKRADNVKQGSSNEEAEYESIWGFRGIQDDANDVLEDCIRLYGAMIEQGVAPEQARMILPQNMYTEFYMTGNLRNWAHFLKLRLDGHAQLEVQQIAEQVLHILEPLFPESVKALMKYD